MPSVSFLRCARLAGALLLACPLASRAGETGSWGLDSPVADLREPLRLPVRSGEGIFDLKISLSMRTLDGSAASIWFGERLNFGFDGRAGNLFVEGPALGRTIELAPIREHLRAGERFDFRAERLASGITVFSIGEKEVFRTEKLARLALPVRIRPHRNVLAIDSIDFSGDLVVPEPGVVQSRPVVPILTEGKARPLLELTVTLAEARVLERAVLAVDGGIAIADLGPMEIRQEDDRVFGTTRASSREIVISGALPLAAGTHVLKLLGSIRTGVDPITTLDLRCLRLDFAGGVVFTPPPPDRPAPRLAYSIHQRGEFGCHTFRIPGIARTNKGTLLAVYDMRYNSARDLQEHMDIGLSRSEDGGQTWSRPVAIMDMGEFGGKPQKENGCSDPNILVDRRTGEVLVSAVWTHGKPGTHQWVGRGSEPGHDIHVSSQFLVVRSRDDGRTWSEPENLTARLKDPAWHLFAPAPGNGITMRDGTLVMPTQGRDERGVPFSNLMWSRDHGKSWVVSAHARSDTTECAIAELSDGSLLLNMRDNRNRRDKSATNGRAMGRTTDLGRTWEIHPADHGALPEPVCMASMISHHLPDGRHVLIFSNPRNKEARRDMTIQVSFDDGATWPERHHLLLDEAGGAYSSLVMVDDSTLGILYESSQADLVFQKIPLAGWLTAAP